jgi:hypothetical protein
MNKRQFLTTLALSSLAPFCSGQEISDKGDTILKLIKKYKFDAVMVEWYGTFGDITFQTTQHLDPKKGYLEHISTIENESSFEKWVGVTFLRYIPKINTIIIDTKSVYISV